MIDALDRVKNSFNSYPVDRLAEAAAVVALEDDAYFRQCRDKIVATREWTQTQLTTLGFRVLPSAANFLFAEPPEGVDAAQLAQKLREARILVRYFDKPRIERFLRITIGNDEEMNRLIETLRTLIG